MANGVDAATQTTESVVNHHIDTSQAVESHPLEQVAASSAVPSSSTFLAGPLIQEPTSITSKESPVVTPTPRDDLVNNRQFSFVDEPATLNGQSAPLDTSIPIRDQHADVNVKPDAQSKPRPKEPFKMPRNKQEALDLVRMRKHTLRKACFFFERRTGTLGIVVVWLVIGAWMGGKSFISASEGSAINLKVANTIFAIFQLFIVFGCLFGFIAIYNNSATIVRYFANIAAILVLLETVQAFFNFLFSAIWHEYFVAQCSYSTEVFWNATLLEGLPNVLNESAQRCKTIGGAEIALQALRFLVTLGVSGYWAACIASYATSREKLAAALHLEEDPETLAYKDGVYVPRNSLDEEDLHELAQAMDRQGLNLRSATAPAALTGTRKSRSAVYIRSKRIDLVDQELVNKETYGAHERGMGVAGLGFGAGLMEATAMQLGEAEVGDVDVLARTTKTQRRKKTDETEMVLLSPRRSPLPSYYKPEAARKPQSQALAAEEEEEEEEDVEALGGSAHRPISPEQDLLAEQKRFKAHSARKSSADPHGFLRKPSSTSRTAAAPRASKHHHGSVFVVLDDDDDDEVSPVSTPRSRSPKGKKRQNVRSPRTEPMQSVGQAMAASQPATKTDPETETKRKPDPTP